MYKQLKEVFNTQESKLKEAQQLLKKLNTLDLAEGHKEARRRVEDHFDVLSKAVFCRRDKLLELVDSIFNQTGMHSILT